MSPSLAVMAGPAPSARKMARSSAPTRIWRPITWAAISSVASAAMAPNTPSAMDSGLIARSAFASATELSLGNRLRLPGDPREFGGHRGGVSASVVELEESPRELGATLTERPVERRGQDHVLGTERIDVVLHDGVVEHHDANHLEVDPPVRLVRRVAAIRRLRLRVGEHTDRNHGSNMYPGESGLTLGDDNLVDTLRIGEPPACDERTVHGRELAAGTAGQHCRLLARRLESAGGHDPVSVARMGHPQRHDIRIEHGEGANPFHMGQVRDLGDETRVVPAGAGRCPG